MKPDPAPDRRPFSAGGMILRTTLTSPFGRKVRIAADVLGLADDITIDPANTLDPEDSLRWQNPLGKMPCLLLADGAALFDSRVILDYLGSLSDRCMLVPPAGMARYRILTRAALADGIADAALLAVYEGRFRPPQRVSRKWLDHQRGKIHRGLAAFEMQPPDAGRTDLVSIGLSCALGYLDWRHPIDWRSEYPTLVAWLDRFAECEPAFGRTAAD